MISFVVIGSIFIFTEGAARNGSHRRLGGHISEIGALHSEANNVDTKTANLGASSNGIDARLLSDTAGQLQGHTKVQQQPPPPRGFFDLHALDIDGNDVSFSDFEGKVVLVVNVASACGYTEQNYVGLQALVDKYGQYGLEIVAFPSNQFGGQEPGTEQHIKQYVKNRFNVTFRMMSKVNVNGPNAHPVFKYLKRNLPVEQGGGGGGAPGNELVWNFNKFLIDKRGRPMAFYYQNFDGPRLESDVYMYLSASR